MEIKTDFNPTEFAENDFHGVVVQTSATSDGALERFACVLDKKKYSESRIERIIKLEDKNIFIFVWPKNASVDMPSIISVFERIKIARVETLCNFIKQK